MLRLHSAAPEVARNKTLIITSQLARQLTITRRLIWMELSANCCTPVVTPSPPQYGGILNSRTIRSLVWNSRLIGSPTCWKIHRKLGQSQIPRPPREWGNYTTGRLLIDEFYVRLFLAAVESNWGTLEFLAATESIFRLFIRAEGKTCVSLCVPREREELFK